MTGLTLQIRMIVILMIIKVDTKLLEFVNNIDYDFTDDNLTLEDIFNSKTIFK